MAKIYNIEEGLNYLISELICINCKERFLDVRPMNVWLKDCTCPKCQEKGYLIDTGEFIPDKQYEKIINENPKLKIYRNLKYVYQKEG